MRSFTLAATGRDRPGIVAAVTEALLAHGVNIEDAEMAILRGHFAIVLVLAAPDDVDVDSLRARLDAVAAEVPLEALSLSEVEALGGGPRPEVSHAISVYGADRPGIVHAVAGALADLGVNIVDLSTRVVGDEPLYAMLIEVTLPAGLDDATLEGALGRVAAELGVDVSARASGADVL
jgi:glycine cleavage system transcriptional repressor